VIVFPGSAHCLIASAVTSSKPKTLPILHTRTHRSVSGFAREGRACSMRYSIGPKTGIGFRKARCVDSTTWSVLCASEWTHGALEPDALTFMLARLPLPHSCDGKWHHLPVNALRGLVLARIPAVFAAGSLFTRVGLQLVFLLDLGIAHGEGFHSDTATVLAAGRIARDDGILESYG
jgi:hypothetical protein